MNKPVNDKDMTQAADVIQRLRTLVSALGAVPVRLMDIVNMNTRAKKNVPSSVHCLNRDCWTDSCGT